VTRQIFNRFCEIQAASKNLLSQGAPKPKPKVRPFRFSPDQNDLSI